MRVFVLIAALLSLTACGDAAKNGERMATGVKNNLHETAERIDAWMQPTPEKLKNQVPDSYCYSTRGDVLCYRSPMPGWETRLVGYQGTNAIPPQMAMMQPLPSRTAVTAMKPENRAETSKPLVVSVAVEPKSDAPIKGDAQVVTVDTAHESLPDPALAPQL